MAQRPLRVLHVIDRLSAVGGAERFALGLMTHLDPERVASSVCATRSAEPGPRAELAAAGIELHELQRRGAWDLPRTAGLGRVLRTGRFDVLHAHMFGSNLWGAIFGRTSRVPVVLAHEQTWSYQGNPVRAFLDGRVIGRLVTRFIAVSRLDASRMVELERVPPEKVLVMPNAYIPSPAGESSDIRSELDIPPEAPIVFTAALLRPQKALEVLIDAFAEVVGQVPDARLLIAGDGPLRGALTEQIGRLGLGGSVHLLGIRTDIDAILASATVGAMSSDYEGMPLFGFECMAAQRPLVATAVGALPDIIRDGHDGRLVPARQPAALAGALVELLRDRTRTAEMGRAAAATAADYSIDAVARRFAELYETLSAEHAA